MGQEFSPIFPAHKISNIYLPIIPMLVTLLVVVRGPDLLRLIFPAPGTFCVLYIYHVSDRFAQLFVSQLWWFGPKLHLLYVIFMLMGRSQSCISFH